MQNPLGAVPTRVQAPGGAVTSKVQAPRGALTSYIHYSHLYASYGGGHMVLVLRPPNPRVGMNCMNIARVVYISRCNFTQLISQ